MVNYQKKYNIWEKIKDSIKKELDTELVYNKKYLKGKIKYYDGKLFLYFFRIEEYKYVVSAKKIPNYIIKDIEISSDSDSDEEILIIKIQMEKNSDEEIEKNSD